VPQQTPGQRLKVERERAGYSLREAASLAGIGHSTLRRWELDVTLAQSGPALRRLCELYEVRPLYLLHGDQEDHQ
jgi:transcriptional regulator with XRE-family HTH domain